jgi:hypothetical protein
MIPMRALKIFLLGLAPALFTGCAGYHLGAVNGAVAGEKSVEVLPFNNQTFQPRLGEALTQAVRERLQVDGTYHLATHGPGDVIVTGVIRLYARESLGFSSTDVATPEDYRVGATVHVTVRERSTGRLLLEKDVKGHALVNIGNDLASAERQALPLLADDVAQNIAELLTEGAW